LLGEGRFNPYKAPPGLPEELLPIWIDACNDIINLNRGITEPALARQSTGSESVPELEDLTPSS
jgi:hypothetical protein